MIRVGVLKYHCLKCSKPVILEYRPVMDDRTAEMFTNMFDSKLCLDCYCNSKVPEIVECLFN